MVCEACGWQFCLLGIGFSSFFFFPTIIFKMSHIRMIDFSFLLPSGEWFYSCSFGLMTAFVYATHILQKYSQRILRFAKHSLMDMSSDSVRLLSVFTSFTQRRMHTPFNHTITIPFPPIHKVLCPVLSWMFWQPLINVKVIAWTAPQPVFTRQGTPPTSESMSFPTQCVDLHQAPASNSNPLSTPLLTLVLLE